MLKEESWDESSAIRKYKYFKVFVFYHIIKILSSYVQFLY